MQQFAVCDVDVGPAIAIVVENSHAAAGCLKNVLLVVHSSVHIQHMQAGLGCDILKPCWTWVLVVSRVRVWR